MSQVRSLSPAPVLIRVQPPRNGRHFFVLRLAITDRAKTMTELEEAIQDLELEVAEDMALDEFGDQE